MHPVHVHFLPELVDQKELAGSTCAVIDVLRATTTIVEALANGATAVAPRLTIEDARQLQSELGSQAALLGGERGGRTIAGFDLGNSPSEYTRAVVSGKTVVLTTTNGTKALLHCRSAAEIRVAALVNLTACAQQLQRASKRHPVHILCAGTDGCITREDVLVAGALIAELDPDETRLTDQALIARDEWQHTSEGNTGNALEHQLRQAMQCSRGGRNLVEIGMAADIALAARVNRYQIVPAFDPSSGLIRLEAGDA